MSDSPSNDDTFLEAFLAGTLQPRDFGHLGHLRAGWLMLRRHPPAEAIDATCAAIARLAGRLGAPGKFHRTRSEALLRLMLQRGAARLEGDFESFVQHHPDLVADARGLLARHYSPARLDSPEARRMFLPPDLCPLPA